MVQLGSFPTARGGALLIVGAALCFGAWVLREAVLLWPGIFLVALVLLSWAGVWALSPKLVARRTITPVEVAAGDTISVDLALQQRPPALAGSLEIEERLPASFGPAPSFTLTVPGRREPSHLHYACWPARRGRYELTGLRYRFSDPLGLVARGMRAAQSTTVLVTPQVLPLGRGGGAFGRTGETPVPHLAFGGPDDVMVREYRPRDDVRRIHWPSTARMGSLMVRSEEQAWDPEAWLPLDARASVYDDDAQGEERFEWLVTLVASVGVSLLNQGFDVTLSDGHSPAFLAQSRQQAAPQREWLRHLVDVEVTVDASLPQARHDLAQSPIGQLVVALLGRLSVEDANDLVSLGGSRSECWALYLSPPTSPPSAASDLDAARRILADHGWTAVPVEVGADPRPAWAAITGANRSGR